MESLRNRRLELNMTQRDVAEEVGISERGYQNYELGSRVPNVLVGLRIAKALQMDPTILFKDTTENRGCQQTGQAVNRQKPHTHETEASDGS